MFARTLALTSLTAMSLAARRPPMGYDDARHLLARTGFGPTDAEVRDVRRAPASEAVDAPPARHAHDCGHAAARHARVDTGPLRRPGPEARRDEERKAFQQQQVRHGLELRAWWVQEMLATPSPLTERMTLFWHNHFVSSQQKVRFARLMYAQNATLRANALGNFATLLHAASKDPAMLIYLDIAQSRKGQPNENFAREVMELFTLGEGQYTEQDIKEAARAFTGWSLDRETGDIPVPAGRPRLTASRRCSARIGQLRRRRGARHPPRAAADVGIHHRQAVARVRVARSRSARSEAHRASLPRLRTTTSRSRCAALLL